MARWALAGEEWYRYGGHRAGTWTWKKIRKWLDDERKGDAPYPEKHAPEDALAELVLDMVEGRPTIGYAKHGRAHVPRFVVAHLPDEGHGLGHEAPAHLPLHRVRPGKAEKVAGCCIVDGDFISVVKG